MQPEEVAILPFFANVPFPDPAGFDGIPKTLPKTLVVVSRMENGHVLADELAFGISGKLEESAVDGDDDSGRIRFDGSFVASEEVDYREKPRFLFTQSFHVLFEKDVFERDGKDSVFGEESRDGVPDSFDNLPGVRPVAVSSFERRKRRSESVGHFLPVGESELPLEFLRVPRFLGTLVFHGF